MEGFFYENRRKTAKVETKDSIRKAFFEERKSRQISCVDRNRQVGIAGYTDRQNTRLIEKFDSHLFAVPLS